MPGDTTPDDVIKTLQSLGIIPNVNAGDKTDAPAAGIPDLTPIPTATNSGDQPSQTQLPAQSAHSVMPDVLQSLSNTKPNESPVGASTGPFRGSTPPTNAGAPTNQPDYRSPKNPYGEDVPTTAPKFADVNNAQSGENAALQAKDASLRQATLDKFDADKARQDRVVQVNQDYVKQLNEADLAHQRDRDLAHKAAAAETASWMKDMDKKAAEEPQSGRWWHNQSGFGQALWLLSMAFSTKAAMTPGVKNVAVEMINQEIDNDINTQRETNKKQLEAIRNKGAKMTELQKQKLDDLQDDYTHKIGRINALQAANTVRANATDNKDLKAQYSAIDDELNKQKLDIAVKRVDKATAERMKDVEERHADIRQNISLRHAEILQNNSQDFHKGENVLNRDLQRELAEEKIAAKIDAAGNKQKETHFEIPSQSGISVTSKDPKTGKPISYNLAVPKELGKEAWEISQAGQAKVVGLAGLRDALKDGSLPYGTFTNDIASRQALKNLADPTIRQMSGRFNKDTVKEVQELILGEDPTSFISRLKGGTKEEIIDLLNKEIQEAPGATKQKLLAMPGTNLANDPNANITFTAPDTRGPASHTMTGDEKVEAATGKSPEAPKLNTKDDIKNFGDDALKALPSELQNTVETTTAKFNQGTTPDNVKAIKDKAIETIDAWNKAHPGGELASSNAKVLIDDASSKAGNTASKVTDLASDIADKYFNDEENISKKTVQDVLTKKKITAISSKEIQDIVEEAHKRIEFMRTADEMNSDQRESYVDEMMAKWKARKKN
jgi:hypothetical protein